MITTIKRASLILALLAITLQGFAARNPRSRVNFDFDWKFTLNNDDPAFAQPVCDDSEWEDVQIPHDWNIKDNFVEGRGSDGSAANLPGGIGWYRKTFDAPSSWKGKTITIIFDGIQHQSDVFINGHHLGFHPYGYTSIVYDLTPYLKYGQKNVIAVRANTTGQRPRWYAGAGIYRHVVLDITDVVHVDTYGTYITIPEVSRSAAKVNVVTTVKNDSNRPVTTTVLQRILDASGKQVGSTVSASGSIAPGAVSDISVTMNMVNPSLWDIDSPVLYTMETTVKTGASVKDVYKTSFGVRSARFDKDKGFLLNGERVKLQGVCLHTNSGSLGVAMPDRAFERCLEVLKEYGVNAIRFGHHQPQSTFLDMCDRMGFIVYDEAFDKWKSGYYAQYFDEWWQKDLENMLLRDRNHPCVVVWSIGNELSEANLTTDEGVERAAMLQDFVHQFEPTRQVSLAAQNNHQFKFAGVTDVIGYNYLEARLISEKTTVAPERITLVTEELPFYRGEEGNIRSYTPLNPWELVAENDFIAGGFIWSGVDYVGEASMGSRGWPAGLFDVTMYEKPRAAYHRSVWNDEPVVRINVPFSEADIDMGRDLWQWPKLVNHWNLPSYYLGMVIPVETTTNCEEVQLFQDGHLMGVQKTADFTNNTIVWYLPYRPGKLEAKGLIGGEVVANCEIATSGNTVAAEVKADRESINADGQDLSFISVQLVDQNGIPVQTDDKMVTISVEGDGRLLGVDSGDLRLKGSFACNAMKTYFGRVQATVQSTRKAGSMTVKVEVEGFSAPYYVTVTTQ
jgi:beta-galactosidase